MIPGKFHCVLRLKGLAWGEITACGATTPEYSMGSTGTTGVSAKHCQVRS